MKLVSKYAGKCYKCDQSINKGDLIDYVSDQNPAHWSCPVHETPYDNSVAACALRARDAGLPERTQYKNRPMMVQCLCGHSERYDLFPDNSQYPPDHPKSDESLLIARGAWKCDRCVREQKHKTPKQLKAARANCAHSWEWISHEERKCVRCGAIEFVPDMD